MPEKINWTLNVQIPEGPKLSAADSIGIEAYDKLEVVVQKDAEAEDIEIQPGETGQVQFLLIKSDRYGSKLSYSVNAAEADETKRIKLDALQLLIGDGAVKLLGASPKKLFFYNKLDQAAAIQILVGRKATTPSP
jgi:hypothetical protein